MSNEELAALRAQPWEGNKYQRLKKLTRRDCAPSKSAYMGDTAADGTLARGRVEDLAKFGALLSAFMPGSTTSASMR